VKATVVMPEDAPQAKVDATRGYGAEVLRYDRCRQDPDAVVRTLVESRGMTLIPPFDHPHVMAGQGTLAKELFEDVGELDMLATPLGGGLAARQARRARPARRRGVVRRQRGPVALGPVGRLSTPGHGACRAAS
jgi:threonine dehydratase